MLANEYIVKAEGWSEFDLADQEDGRNQERLDVSHKIAKLFTSKAGKEVLDLMVRQYLLADIALPNDTQIAVGIKQGKASVVKEILAHIEISNNAK